MEREIVFESDRAISEVCGNFDENIFLIEKELGVKIFIKGDVCKITGDDINAKMAHEVVTGLIRQLSQEESIDEQVIRYFISLAREGNIKSAEEIGGNCICVTSKGKPVKPKTVGQKHYVNNILENTISLGVGPAGTGKTYLAVACAVNAFKAKEISRIILTRPAIEAGEKLGFLPGDLQSKVDPYLRPLYDALFDMLGSENFSKYSEKGLIEVAPLAYMRGRTLDDCFVILDEAQNTTPEQMKMFLTRIGFNTKAVITGDITQTDLPTGKKSGLKEAMTVLKNIEGISITRLSPSDVVRHPLVQKIILAYEKYEQRNEKNKGGKE